MANVDIDRRYVAKHVTFKVIQAASLLTPPILGLISYRSKLGLSFNTFLRRYSLATFVGGGLVGYGMSYGRMRNMESEGVRDRASRLRVNVGQVRTDDYATIGAVVGSVGTAAILYGRTPLLFTAVPGGAAIGIAGGVLTHLFKSLAAQDDLSPQMMMEEAKEALPLRKTVEQVENGQGMEVVQSK